MTNGFKDKDGKFHPTENDSKKLSSHQVEEPKDTPEFLKKESVSLMMNKLKLRSERKENHQDPNTGEPLEVHPDDEYWLKHHGHMARDTNKKGKRWDDRGRESLLSEKQKQQVKEEYPFQKFASNPLNSKKQLCDEIMCENQSGNGTAQAVAQFKIISVDESMHTEGMLYGHEGGDTICASCLSEVAFHGVDWEDDRMRNPEKYEKEYIDDDEMERAIDDSDLPDFKSAKYKEPFDITLMHGDVEIEYDPNGFSKKEEW